jgi:hypothetical protein
MEQLETESGPGGIGPWFGAEHRNTAHHHVHIVLAARREIEPGKFQTVVITRGRLQRMKDAIALEIERQRGLEIGRGERTLTQRQTSMVAPPRQQSHAVLRWRQQRARPLFGGSRSLSTGHVRGGQIFGTALLRLRVVARTYQLQMERELEEDLARREREGWVR